MRIIPINVAEAIIDPFWDRQISGFPQWLVELGEAHGLRVRQEWCWVTFQWARTPEDGPALRMTRQYDLDCTGYDMLLVSVMAPEGSIFRMTAVTDAGTRTFEAPPAPKLKKEHALPLQGATRLESLTLEIIAAGEGIAAGWFNWVGLQNATLLPHVLRQWNHVDAAWEPYLKPEGFAPSFHPAYGLLVSAEELDGLRVKHQAFLDVHGTSPFIEKAEEARAHVPETMIRDFVNFWGDTRYCRERDQGNVLLAPGGPIGHGANAAIAGLLTRDADLLRLAARYALALGMCEHWDDGMICALPGGVFEHRCFVQSLCAYEAALILDLAGEYFTDMGRDFLMRRLAEEGLGTINFNTWKHEYIFHCNQLAWFTPGRMLAYAMLEQHWPRVKPYTDLAYQDLIESLGYALLSDGGYVEGPTYFRCVGRDGGLSLYYYSRLRGKTMASLIPEPMKRTADFAAAIASTNEDADVIPFSDAGSRSDVDSFAVMAAALPDSQWTAIYRKAILRTDGMPNSLLALKLDADIPAASPPPPSLVSLPEMGVLASTRMFNGEVVKLFIMGNKSGAGHCHEDKGSFVLEFTGDTFALDPGTCDYSSPLAGLMKQCERHNMLVPTGMAERPRPQNPLMADVRPAGQGDTERFSATIDATPGWERYYTTWSRAWDSPAPHLLTITDRWELAQGDGVEFYWQTTLPVTFDGQTITLRGKRGMATITAPDGCIVRVDELPLLNDAIQRRIAICREGEAGEMTIRVELALVEKE